MRVFFLSLFQGFFYIILNIRLEIIYSFSLSNDQWELCAMYIHVHARSLFSFDSQPFMYQSFIIFDWYNWINAWRWDSSVMFRIH